MNNTQIKPVLTPGLYFIVIGPLVGFALVLICLIIAAIPEMFTDGFGINNILLFFQISLAILIYGFFVAYLVGMLPALVTGVISGKGETNTQQIKYAVISGAISCLLLTLPFKIEWMFNLGAFVLGAFSGLGCILLRHRKIRQLNQ